MRSNEPNVWQAMLCRTAALLHQNRPLRLPVHPPPPSASPPPLPAYRRALCVRCRCPSLKYNTERLLGNKKYWWCCIVKMFSSGRLKYAQTIKIIAHKKRLLYPFSDVLYAVERQ